MSRGFTAFFFFALLAVCACPAAASSDLSASEKISADELRAKQTSHQNFLLLDARDRKSYDDGHIAGAVLPLPEDFYDQEELHDKQIIAAAPNRDAALAVAMREVPRSRDIVTYCNTDCNAGVHLLVSLRSLGFSSVKVMEEGFQAWQAKGYPVEKKD